MRTGRKTLVATAAVLCLCCSTEIEVAAGFDIKRFAFDDHVSMQEPKNIVGGVPAKRDEFPFVASIRYPDRIGRRDLGGRHFCAGSLIAKNVNLTAGHCVDDVWLRAFDAKPVVTLGRLEREGHTYGEGFETFQTKATKIHPLYNERRWLDYDIALIVLDGNSTQPLVGYRSDEECFEPASGCDRGTVVGWGVTDYSHKRTLAEELIKVEVPLVPWDECHKVLGFLTESMVCAGEPGKDACRYDSGGPLLVEQRVAGVVSFGMGCGAGYPAVYGNVARVKDWIRDELRGIDAGVVI